MTSSSQHRQRACAACADAKRRCDRQQPECRRCLDNEVLCVYPSTRKRHRMLSPSSRHLEKVGNVGPEQDYSISNTREHAVFSSTGYPLLISRLGDGNDNSLGIEAAEGISSSSSPSSIPPPYTFSPWFLSQETWCLYESQKGSVCNTFEELQPVIPVVREMLVNWVKEGHNSFIHAQLYAQGMPRCIQDAYVTTSAYLSAQPKMVETILHIANEHANELSRQSVPEGNASQLLRFHLARVQALFAYSFLRLFDGSIQPRAAAERQLPLLRHWIGQMWEAARELRGEIVLPTSSDSDGQLDRDPNSFGRQHAPTSKLWHLWILAESVRRTQLLADTIINIFKIMTVGWSECMGAPMLTIRKGLWEAGSAFKWLELCCAQSPLLTPSLQPSLLLAQHNIEEIDTFVVTFWKFIVGSGAIESWKDSSSERFEQLTRPIQ